MGGWFDSWNCYRLFNANLCAITGMHFISVTNFLYTCLLIFHMLRRLSINWQQSDSFQLWYEHRLYGHTVAKLTGHSSGWAATNDSSVSVVVVVAGCRRLTMPLHHHHQNSVAIYLLPSWRQVSASMYVADMKRCDWNMRGRLWIASNGNCLKGIYADTRHTIWIGSTRLHFWGSYDIVNQHPEFRCQFFKSIAVLGTSLMRIYVGPRSMLHCSVVYVCA